MWLLEVNSYPAIHSGTMSSVDAEVYTALVRDILSLVVLPALRNLPPMQVDGQPEFDSHCHVPSPVRK